MATDSVESMVPSGFRAAEQAAAYEGLGRFVFSSSASQLNPFAPGIEDGETSFRKRTEISKMKGQDLSCGSCASLLAVNVRYIAYAMKEGVARIISQDGKNMFKLNKSTKAAIIDMCMVGSGEGIDEPCHLVCLDDGRRVSLLDAATKQHTELVFSSVEAPFSVESVWSQSDLLFTAFKDHVTVWSVEMILAAPASPAPEESERDVSQCSFRVIDEDFTSRASCQAVLPGLAEGHEIIDIAISPCCQLIVAVTSEHLVVWQFDRQRIGTATKLDVVQIVSLHHFTTENIGVGSVNIISRRRAQVVVVGSESGSELYACEFNPESSSPVGSLLQSLKIMSREPHMGKVRVHVNVSKIDAIVLTFAHEGFAMSLPLAGDWESHPACPFPIAQRLYIEAPAHQMVVLTGRGRESHESVLFFYHAYNFVRDKDQLMGCCIVVDEVSPNVVECASAFTPSESATALLTETQPAGNMIDDQGNAPPPGIFVAPAASADLGSKSKVSSPAEVESEALEPSSQGETDDIKLAVLEAPQRSEPRIQKASNKTSTSQVPRILSRDATKEVSNDASEGEGDTNGLTVPVVSEGENDGEREQSGKKESVDWGLLKQCAASFVKGLDKRREEMAEKILAEVTEAMQTHGASAEGNRDALDQALTKVREAREAQVANEKNVAVAVKKATDSWFEASSSSVNSLLQKELTKISDGVASNLAQQLSQSRRFCEAISRGVQKTNGVATKHALESLRPQQQLQDVVGRSLADALHESLGPVFRTELRAHLEKELCPLIEQRIGEMMSTLRDKIGSWMDGISEQHELAAKKLGSDLGPIVTKELRDAEHVVAQRLAGNSNGHSENIPESQMDELVQCLQVEVVDPLHARIRDLTAEVKTLREETSQLQRRWNESRNVGAPESDVSSSLQIATSLAAGLAVAGNPREDERRSEETNVQELTSLFNAGKVNDSFMKAITYQSSAKHVDYLGRVCSMIEDYESWLDEDRELSVQTKMFLMLSLARQVADKDHAYRDPGVSKESKIKWINELWLNFDADDATVATNAAALCKQLHEVLEKAAADNTSEAMGKTLKDLVRSVRNGARLLESK